ncbi:hypothetical protein GGS21DRAFT_425935 [Xylaria nigripes]|nr:hypothetical protein GGS21DRAFT_425935 [Xylaria nigripes]
MSKTRFEKRPAEQLEKDNGVSSSRQNDSRSCSAIPKTDDLRGPDAEMRDLIEFFKKTPPPPTNYMSIPDESSGSEQDRWQKLKKKVFRSRRKTPKWRPPVIMLPDSAVSARTTDGHRYIAISIPTEYSHLAPLSNSQYPVYDSIEAAFQREINSRFGMWKRPPSNRVVAVLNPVAEDRRKSRSVRSRPPAAASSRRARPRSISLTPTQQQRYTPGKASRLGKTKSLGAASRGPRFTDVSAESQTSGDPVSMPWPNSQDILLKLTGVAASSRPQDNPIITLTLPSRKSSKRGIRAAPMPPDTTDESRKSSDATSDNLEGDDSGIGGKDPAARHSFAASIDTTNSSPAPVLRAQTAKAYHSVPIVVRPSGTDIESPAILKPPEHPSGKGKTDDSAKAASAEGQSGPSTAADEKGTQSRKKKVHEKKKRDIVKLKETGQGKGTGSGEAGEKESTKPASGKKTAEKGEEPQVRAFPLVPKPPSSSYSSSSPSTVQSSESSREQVPKHTSSHHRQKEDRAEREARYISKALAEEQATLENLPREELIRRYESLREQNIYEREKRLRRLERNRDTWARTLPTLLQDLNGLLREQHRLLQGAGLTHGEPGLEGSSRPYLEGHRRHSIDLSLVPSGPHRGHNALGARRSRSLHSSNGSSPGYLSSKSQAS